MTDSEFLLVMERHGQREIVDHFNRLNQGQRGELLGQAGNLDFDLLFSLYQASMDRKKAQEMSPSTVGQARIHTLGAEPGAHDRSGEVREAGETLLRRGKVAVLIVAGGQGSRLGFSGPKGCLCCSPVKRKSLFQLFAEQIKALSLRYGVKIPLLIMTSPENESDTVCYFRDREYFGLGRDAVFFFSQAFLPSITPQGQLILKDETHFFTNPDGHGGSIKALRRSGLLQELLDGGCTELFYCQVDNPLVKIADPPFLGRHALARAEVSTKVVRRVNVEEKVGVYVSRNGRDAIVEYSEMGKELMEAVDDRGKILYWAGNTAIHCFHLPFLKHLSDEPLALPYHCAAKEVEAIDHRLRASKITGWKFEAFVFDAIPLATRTCCVEASRQEEFSPIKNSHGPDSPETAERAMVELHKAWLRRAGIAAPDGIKVEISPLLALDEQELAVRMRGRRLVLDDDVCIE